LVVKNAVSPVPQLPAAAEEAKNAGNDLFKVGKWEEAYAKYSEAIQAAPNSAVLYSNRSAALLKARRIDEAIADGLKATQLDEKWGKGWYRYAEGLGAKFPRDNDLIAEAYSRAYKYLPEGIQKIESKVKLDVAQGLKNS